MRSAWHDLEIYLQSLAGRWAEPTRGILAVSGHWQEPEPTVDAGAHPSLQFDH